MNENNDRDFSSNEEPVQPQQDNTASGAGEEGRQPDNGRWNAEPDRPQQNQNPYRGAPYSPDYPNNPYPPHCDGGYTQNQNDRRYHAYQYSANSGWQQPVQPQDKYEWKFEDYEKFDQKRGSGGKKHNRGLIVFTVALLVLLSGGLITLAVYSFYTTTSGERIADVAEIRQEESTGPAAAGGEMQINSYPAMDEPEVAVGEKMTIPQVAEAVLPSVVGVVRYDNDQYYEITNYGSGIVMSQDGYIITNAHVVAGGSGFKVQFTDGDAFDADIIGFDTVTDLAVLKIEAHDLVPAQFGDSDSVRVGESVVAIGNPAGDILASSVTVGVISAVNREVRTTNYKMNFLQTDAAINPGNSGGALANEYGLVIGINSAKITAADYEGIGFAIPISSAKPVIDDIIANGKVTGRVMLGISSRSVIDEVDARNYGIQMGIVVDSVENPGLIDAGILRGDILTHIDDVRVYNLSDLREVLDTHKPGDVVSLTFYRRIGTREQTFEVESELMESQ